MYELRRNIVVVAMSGFVIGKEVDRAGEESAGN